MVICGNIYIDKKVNLFSIRCVFCLQLMSLNECHDFVNHIKRFHNLDEPDPLVELTNNHEETFYTEENIDFSSKNEFIEKKHKDDVAMSTTGEKSNEVDNINEESYNLNLDEVVDDKSELSDSINDNDDSLSNDTYSEILKKKYNTKLKLSFRRRTARAMKLIELFQDATCLWNPVDEYFKNLEVRKRALNNIKDKMKDEFGIKLTEPSIFNALENIRSEYINILNMVKNGDKVAAAPMAYFQKCSFLARANNLDSQKETDTATPVLCFTNVNSQTLDFISGYQLFPILHGSNSIHSGNNELYSKAYEDLSKLLESKYNLVLNGNKIRESVNDLRNWYYKICLNKCSNNGNPETEALRLYSEKLSFMPLKKDKKLIKCDTCPLTFFSEKTLQTHMFRKHHIGELPYKCKHCSKGFENKSGLSVHQKRLHNGKDMQCSTCKRKFAVRGDLELHERVHTGFKPFVCEQCGKSFRVKTQLQSHVTAIHTKIRAFKCNMCPKDFLKKRDLTDHIKAHLNIRDKICETCGKGFTNIHSLIRHRQIHSEIKKFACKLCDARFHQFVGLNSHMKRTHNIVKDKINAIKNQIVQSFQ